MGKRSPESELLILAKAVAAGRIDPAKARARASRLGRADDFARLLDQVCSLFQTAEATRVQPAPTPALAPAQDPPEPRARRRIGRHEILEEIGRGAMGIVYLAREVALDRTVALKVLIAGQDADEETIGRFLREARTAARVRHDHLVEIYEVGKEGERFYYSMEYVPGRTLADEVADGPIEPERAARIVRDAARGLAAAHAVGIVHRDVKPSNILLAEGDDHVFLTDFGLGKSLTEGHDLTRTGVVMGTPVFMPPEQARGDLKTIGATSDVYSLAATLYTALTRRYPFDADLPTYDLLAAIQRDSPIPAGRLVPRLPVDLGTIVEKGLEKDPLRRYADAGELADDLDRFLGHEPIRARPPGPVRRGALWARRHPARAAGLGALAVALLALGAVAAARVAHRSRVEARISEGERQVDAGDPWAAIAAYQEALALAPDDDDALRGRQFAVRVVVEQALGRIERGDLDAAAAERSRLEGIDPGPDESSQIRRLTEALTREDARRESIEEDLAAAAIPIRSNMDLNQAISRVGGLLSFLTRLGRDDPYAVEARARALVALRRLFHRAIVFRDHQSLWYITQIYALVADGRSLEEWGEVLAEVAVEASSVDWATDVARPLPAEAVQVHLFPLKDSRWSGDQEPAVQRLLERKSLGTRFEKENGYFLAIVRAEGHLPARFLLPLPRATRVAVRLKLYPELDLGLDLCHLPAVEVEIEDRLEGVDENSPRGNRIRRLVDNSGKLSEAGDAFVARCELSGEDLLRIMPQPPPTGWRPRFGWRTDAWSFVEGEGRHPVRGINRVEAREIAAEATRLLLPPEIAARWQYVVPNLGLDLDGIYDRLGILPLEGAMLDLFQEAMWGDWRAGARVNIGTGRVRPVASEESADDVSIHGLRDLEGNVSEWLHRGASGLQRETVGGNFLSNVKRQIDIWRIGWSERRECVGLRLALVRGKTDEQVVEPSGDPDVDNRRAVALVLDSTERDGIAHQVAAGILLEQSLARWPAHEPSRLNLAMLALRQGMDERTAHHLDHLIEHATDPAIVRQARFLFVWSLVIRFGSEEEPDWAAGLVQIEALLAAEPDQPVWRLLRALFRLLAGDLIEGLADLQAIMPTLFRLQRFERHLGLVGTPEAHRTGDIDGALKDLFGGRVLAMIGPIPPGEDSLALDATFVERTLPTGRDHMDRVLERWQRVLKSLWRKDVQDRLVERFGRPGETAPVVVGRVAALMARTLGLIGLSKEGVGVARLGGVLAAGRPDAPMALADLLLLEDDLVGAQRDYAAVLARHGDFVPAGLGLAWTRIELGRRMSIDVRSGRLDDAIAVLDRLGDQAAVESAIYRAVIDLVYGRIDEAAGRLEAQTRDAADDPVVWIYLGEIAARRGDGARAADCWDRAVAAERLTVPLVEHLRATRLGG